MNEPALQAAKVRRRLRRLLKLEKQVKRINARTKLMPTDGGYMLWVIFIVLALHSCSK